MAIKINNYHDLSLEELNKELQNKKDALFNMRFQKTLQQLDHPIAIRNLKKDIARIKTRISFFNNER
jgi:large subunit ribosomal protein L29